MAPRIVRVLTIELDAGNAAMVELGKMLGPTGVPPHEVKRRYDDDTARYRGERIPAVVTIADDRSWSISYKTPPTSFLIRRAIGRSGSAKAGHEPAGSLSRAQLKAIAERKLPDLNTADLDAAMRQIEGTARSMGVAVRD
ncbi:uL11 family ribosomal protein [Lysobacter korlensis]|uniref:Large ribosomal subunit protein uL11 n=1 Tax=Lysobacter korlensis TaxID=553636 RepID=A0ABV6RUH9_9GAMM